VSLATTCPFQKWKDSWARSMKACLSAPGVEARTIGTSKAWSTVGFHGIFTPISRGYFAKSAGSCRAVGHSRPFPASARNCTGWEAVQGVELVRGAVVLRFVAPVAILSLLGASPRRPATIVPTRGADTTRAWARKLTGAWSCEGAFANGRAIAADVAFSTELAGQWLMYHHADRAPGTYQAAAMLGPTTSDTALAPAELHDAAGGYRRFRLTIVGDSELVMLRDTTESHARLERFRFARRAEGTLWIGWEVGVNGRWLLGDSLRCVHPA
jgi:hypothetical protein